MLREVLECLNHRECLRYKLWWLWARRHYSITMFHTVEIAGLFVVVFYQTSICLRKICNFELCSNLDNLDHDCNGRLFPGITADLLIKVLPKHHITYWLVHRNLKAASLVSFPWLANLTLLAFLTGELAVLKRQNIYLFYDRYHVDRLKCSR